MGWLANIVRVVATFLVIFGACVNILYVVKSEDFYAHEMVIFIPPLIMVIVELRTVNMF